MRNIMPKNTTINPKILVIGDLMIDHYLWGDCERISPEAPVPVVNISSQSSVLGGAGNVVNNLKTLGAQVDVISVIGACHIADELRELLSDIGVSGQYLLTQSDRITSKKSRIIASQQQVIRYDQESSDNINQKTETELLSNLSQIIEQYEIVLLSDYGKGVLTKSLTSNIIKLANQHRKKVLVDPKGTDYSKYQGAYLLTPNKKEASLATGIPINNSDSLTQAIKQLKNQCDLTVSLITLSEDGIAFYDESLHLQETVAKEVFDVTGAGDTVLASLGYALARGDDIKEAVRFANLAAGVVVGKVGSATVSLDEVNNYQFSLSVQNFEQRIKTHSEISLLAKSLKYQGKKIVFSNGCFDILHRGHTQYLNQAKKFGDVLILGLNSDASVKRLKGQNRPIHSQEDRAYILASLESVDFVVIFDEDTPYELIKSIAPNILVKGGDYKGMQVVGQEFADELKLIQFVAGKSTTKTIKKIQQSNN